MRFLWPGKAEPGEVYGFITAPNYEAIVPGIANGSAWAADLGCLDGPTYVKRIRFNQQLADWLKSLVPFRDKCLFVAGGDVVGNAEATLETYEEFSRYFAGWPLAYVAQNGAEDLEIPADCAAVFVGGDTEWKCSAAAVSVIKRGQEMGKHIHIGRVNWGARYRMFRVLEGSDDFTCDGTRPRFDGRENTISAWRGYENQPPLVMI